MDHQFVSKIKHLPFWRIIMVTYALKLCKFFQFGKNISASQYVIISKISLKKSAGFKLFMDAHSYASIKQKFFLHHNFVPSSTHSSMDFFNICIAVFSSSIFTCKFKRLSNKAALFSAY